MTALPAGSINANLSGEFGGQTAIGNNIVQQNFDHGAVVYNLAPGQVPVVTRRVPPPGITGRRPPDPLGRDREVADALTSLSEASALEFVGVPGAGKTTLLKHVAHQAPVRDDGDGIVFRQVPKDEAVRDTLQFLWDAFYATNVTFVPTDAQLQLDLQRVRAIVVLDDFDRDRSDVERVMDALPQASFLFASTSQALWGDGRSVALPGLDADAAVAVLERGLGPLAEEDRAAATSIAEALDGQPLALLHAAALVGKLRLGLHRLAEDVRGGSGADELARRLVGSLGDEERRVLEVLATLAGATLAAKPLAELTDVEDVGSIIESLLELGLVQAHSPRYSATMAAVVQTPEAAATWASVVRKYFIDWTERHRRQPDVVLEEEQAVMVVLRAAAADGGWADVVSLGRSVEGPLMLGGRWGVWGEVLDLELTGARRTGDRAAEAWALHQLGSRALGLGDVEVARANLTEALKIREQLDDVDGAAVTRHNLDLLAGGRQPPDRTGGGRSPWRLPLIVLLGLVIVGAGLAGWALWPSPDPSRVDLRVEPTRLDFGDQPTGTRSEPGWVTVTNDGDDEVAIGRVSVAGDGANGYQADAGCQGVVLDGGARCTIAVVFEPQDVGGQGAELVVTGPKLDRLVVGLTGTGVGGPKVFDLELAPASVDFGRVDVGQVSEPRPLTVSNVGTSDIDLRRTFEGESAHFVVSDSPANPCPETLPAGARCVVLVAYAPVKPGSHVGAVVVSAEPSGLSARAALTGTGEEPTAPGPGCTLVLPLDPQTVVVGSSIALEVTGKAPGRATLTASGLPKGLAFRDRGDGTGLISGTVPSSPGDVPVAVGCRAGGVIVTETFTLRIVRPTITLRSARPLIHLLLAAAAAALTALAARPSRVSVDSPSERST